MTWDRGAMRLTTGITGTGGAPLGPNACSEPQGSRDELAALARTGTRHHHESRGGALKPLFRHDTPVRRPESNRAAGSLNQCVTIRLGLQIPSFSYGTVLVMDHFYQLPTLGEPDEPMLEAYTALGALASATEKIQLSTLVTGNT